MGRAMSSIEAVKAEIRRFLKSKEPQVLCITGEWGVGKTYAWNELIREASEAKDLSKSKYSYVSLFGLNSLAEVRFSIAENMQILQSDSLQPITEVKNAALGSIKYLKGFVSVIPYVGKALSDSSSLLFSSIVNDQIVCIDDLDRRGSAIRIEDVLGLVTSLRDERQCSVVLLLNEEALNEGKEIFDRHFEKVIDSRLVFAPTPADAVRHGIKGSDDTSNQLRENCILLGISNIRVIRKIQRLVRSIEPLIADRSETIKKQTIHSLTILGWSKYQSGLAPPFKFYADNPYSRIMRSDKDKEMSDEEVSWSAITDRYKFEYLDDYDKKLLEFVKSEVADDDGIKAAAKLQDEEVSKRAANAAIEKGFGAFHGSFSDNLDEVVHDIKEALTTNRKFVNLATLNASVVLLKNIGRKDDALDLIKFYEENQEAEFWEPERDPFDRPTNDPDMQAAIVAHKPSKTEKVDIEAELIDVAQGLNADRIKRVADQITPEKIVELIKARKEAEMRRIIYAGLEFAKFSNASDDMKKIVAAMKQALGMIASESDLNAERAKKYGISIDPTPRSLATVPTV
jgi:Cdc6-like AAA superfamily ATPase